MRAFSHACLYTSSKYSSTTRDDSGEGAASGWWSAGGFGADKLALSELDMAIGNSLGGMADES